MGRGELNEGVLISDQPSFIRYNRESKEFELEEKIEENNRILRSSRKRRISIYPL